MSALTRDKMSALVSDVTKAIFGIWLIAKNQPGADKFFDISVEGFGVLLSPLS